MANPIVARNRDQEVIAADGEATAYEEINKCAPKQIDWIRRPSTEDRRERVKRRLWQREQKKKEDEFVDAVIKMPLTELGWQGLKELIHGNFGVAGIWFRCLGVRLICLVVCYVAALVLCGVVVWCIAVIVHWLTKI